MVKRQGHQNIQKSSVEPYDKNSKQIRSYDEQIDMFLGISSSLKVQQDQIISNMDKSMEIDRSKSQSVETVQIEAQQHSSVTQKSKRNQKTQKSHHHNLQKHTVTALKNIVKQRLFQNYSEDTQRLESVRALWKQFLSIKKKQLMTRKFLTVLFRNDLESVQLLRNYGFQTIYKLYSNTELQAAKVELAKITVKCFNNSAIQAHVQKRQIIKKEQFKLYLQEFRNELENQKLKKRISKISSRKMEELLRNTQ